MTWKVPKNLGEQEGRHLETLNHFQVFNEVSALQFNNLKSEKNKEETSNAILAYHAVFSLSKKKAMV